MAVIAERLELALLGSPDLHLGGQPLARFRSAKVYALLYYLAVTRRTQPRTVLAGLFWGDIGEYYARRNLNRTLSDLTQSVGAYLLVERQAITFDRNQPYWLDVEVLQNAAATPPTPQNVAALAAAVQLYRGDFLEGFYVQDALEFEQWVLSERTRLRASALQLLQTLSQYHAEQGDLLPAMDYTRRVLQWEPWREEAHRQLMLLLTQSGQRSAALAQYELCRQALQSELNVEPDAATLELVARIRAGTIDKVTNDREMGHQVSTHHPLALSPAHPLTPTPPHNLPGQRTPFVGRTTELAELMQLLAEEEDCRLLTLIGPGGMGKTRLALKVAEQVVALPTEQQRFPDGIFFVPLENVNGADGLVSAVISVISAESGFPLRGDAPLQEQLVHFLRDRAILLVLDNFEHLVKEAVLLSTLLAAAPRLKLLVTSRDTLGLQEAWFYPVMGLNAPTSLLETTPQQEEYDAVRLFVKCAWRMRPNFDLDAERTAVLRICTLVEGMPLGIELAAAWLRVMACTQIAQEVERGLDFLTTRYQNLPPRHRSIRAVLDHSWALLTTDAQDAIARLSVFRGKFRQEAASAITGSSFFTLATLAEKALVRVTHDSHYQLHEMTRQYAEEKLVSPIRAALRDAHATYYADLLHQQSSHLFTGAFRQVWATVGGELDNIRHAWEWIIESVKSGRNDRLAPRLLRQMARVLANYYLFQSLWLPGQALFQQAHQVLMKAGWGNSHDAAAGAASPQATLLHIQLLNGLFHLEMGHYGVSLVIAEQALATCRQLELEDDLPFALLFYGRIQLRRGAHNAAAAALQEVLALGSRLGLRPLCAEALISLGMNASNAGLYPEAQGYLHQSLALCQEIGYRPWMSRALTNLGTTFSRQHAYQQALPYYEQALTIAQEEGDQTMIMINTSNLGGVHSGFGRYPSSIEYYQRSLVMARRLGEERWIAANLNGLSITYLAMGDLMAAERVLQEALVAGQRSDSAPDILGTIAHLGHLLARRGQLAEALKALAFVGQHPATMARDHLYNKPLLAELHSELAPALFEQAAAWAAAHSLDEVVHWLLHGGRVFPVPV
jgi:predicted ATPase/DNA-binding SARP family transcriptional activator